MNIKRKSTLYLCRGALIAALYTLLTWIAISMGIGNGFLQFRFSEAMCVLPIFMPEAVGGLYVGCLLANLLTGNIVDVLFGSLATLVGAVGTYLLRRQKSWIVLIPPVLANAVIIPLVLTFGYHMEQAFPLMMLSVGAGELLSVYALGLPLCSLLKKRMPGLVTESQKNTKKKEK